MKNLKHYGWNDEWQHLWHGEPVDRLLAGRVGAVHKGVWIVETELGPVPAKVKQGGPATDGGLPDNPVVGDWVGCTLVNERPLEGMIQRILPRKTSISRKASGRTTTAQVLVANIDLVLLVTSLNADFNLGRLERYLTMVWQTGARPVFLLTKADLCPDPTPYLEELEGIAFGIDTHLLSSITGEGLENLPTYFQNGETAVLIGSSGVGKSTMVNALLGQAVLETREIREDDQKGRHTTTHRQLLALPGGGVIIDTPGLRELQVWGEEDALEKTFADIEALAEACRFRDCSHEREPGCAVREALADGSLDQRRLTNYHKLHKEFQYLRSRSDDLARRAAKQRDKSLAKLIRSQIRGKRG